MALRPLLEATSETVQDLVLAADERYWDAYELAVQGRSFAAIYVAGYSAEMLLKTAGFLFDGALPGDVVNARLKPARAYGELHFRPIKDEGFHSLRFWSAFLVQKRTDAGVALTGPFSTELQQRVDRAYETWSVTMRYRSAFKPSVVANTAENELYTFLDDVDWLRNNHAALWS